ncbi:hypothetical protein DL96DRAFT_1619522 [Flagelloscypha sp. PMI_526]|nr:hypothetical protein DL96DRAFT_1619522 [Flagelloscypha sp. PMI_526]
MDYPNDSFFSYSWHQATVLLMVPYETKEDDVEVVLNQGYIVAGVRNQPPIVKGRVYGSIDPASSSWQLEPRLRVSRHRERTTSNTSTTPSTQSSYALISDQDISSSFAASLEARSGQVSDTDDSGFISPALSSPSLVSLDLRPHPRPVSPGRLIDIASSYSSLESTPPQSGRLLTLHLEKKVPTIWPSLISGPVSEDISPAPRHPSVYKTSRQLEHQYNMDATTLTLLGIEHHDIRKKKEEAFEYFIRGWHQQRVPSATIRLVSNYIPLHADLENLALSPHASHGLPYYVQCLGGLPGVADLYLQAGLLYLEGRASHLLSSPSASLSSLRLPDSSSSTLALSSGGGTEAFKRDQRIARQLFERARGLQPTLEIPNLPYHSTHDDLEMPSMELISDEDETVLAPRPAAPRRRRADTEKQRSKEDAMPLQKQEIKVDNDLEPDSDNSWLLYVPGLVGVSTAIFVVGVVGALSFSFGRSRQGS